MMSSRPPPRKVLSAPASGADLTPSIGALRLSCIDVQKSIAVGLKIVTVLRGVSIDFPAGVSVLFGPNGAGKTTLLKLLSGRVPPTRGFVRCGFSGLPFFAAEGGAGLFDALSVTENLQILTGAPLAQLRQLAGPRLHSVGPERIVSKLSRGERQWLLLLAADLSGASTILLDEPSNGLDPVRRVEFLDLIADWRAAGKCVVIAAHDLELQSRADFVGYIARGKVLAFERIGATPATYTVRWKRPDDGRDQIFKHIPLAQIASLIGDAARDGAQDLRVAADCFAEMYFEGVDRAD